MQNDDAAQVPEDSLKSMLVGRRVWNPEEIRPLTSALNGNLPGVSSLWMLCDPMEEQEILLRTVASFREHLFLTWSARVSPKPDSPTDSRGNILLQRSARRAALKKFPSMPFRISTFSAYSAVDPGVYREIEPLLHRYSGYALGLGHETEGSAASWLEAVKAMEEHFALSFDYPNTPEFEDRRSRLTAAYVETAISSGIMPLIPLNRHPFAGLVLFCPSDEYESVTATLAEHAPVVEGAAGTEALQRLADAGGGLSYL
ncbi:hypothetical protein [Streptomyces wuyuanensis]|uniref:hypothetical protein n=1 Tax=Streptomyces wuyuanensis TaxID=1196353 RepID=UPI0037185E1E